MNSTPDKRREPGLPRRVLFLNDVSFQYGAGIAQARQVECLLSLGIETGVIAWAPGGIPLEAVATRAVDPTLWLGIRDVDHLEGGKDLADDAVIAGLLAEVARFDPEVVIVGNLHAARWPFALLPALARLGIRVITFLHDGYLYTGRCAYPGSCRLYLTGCDETCPTADQYPALAPALIRAAWQVRRQIFGGPNGIEVAANSRWSRRMFMTALPAAAHVETLELGADEAAFRPGDKAAARAHLGLPADKPIVLCAAVNFQEERKGCQYLRAIIAALRDEFTFAAFGHNAGEIPGLIGLGYHLEAHKLALIYQAADVFLGTATEEAFGQTIMEAQLSGLPTVAFHTGGVPEIVRHGITGLLVRNADADAAVAALRALQADPAFLAESAALARACAVQRFSLPAHAARWVRLLRGRTEAGLGHHPATIAYPLVLAEDSQAVARVRPSWPQPDVWLSAAHEAAATELAGEPGWLPGDAFKLFEMGYQAGDVVLEVGVVTGRTAALVLRAALSHPTRTLRPEYHGLVDEPSALAQVRRTLAAADLADLCHLSSDQPAAFLAEWPIDPTMVILAGQRSPEDTAALLRLFSARLKPGTPLLLQGFLGTSKLPARSAVRLAAEEWVADGGAIFMGCFGGSALYTTQRRVT
ncbi:MAG: glycosyltransferase [Opitutaceae bacterium]|nr:glycosyltransferase [Opitutaceae bacterium]